MAEKAQGQIELLRLRDAGFTLEEQSAWVADRRKTLSDAGFSEVEIDGYFGQKPFNPKPVTDWMKANFNGIMEKNAGEEGKPKKPPKEAQGFTQALEAGFQISVSGLLAREQMPEIGLSDDPKVVERLGSSLGMLGGDMPFMVGGALLGGGAGVSSGPGAVITAAGGAFALPSGLRAVIIDAYENGEVRDVNDFMQRASHVAIETTKGWMLGAVTAGAGVGAKALIPATAPKIVQMGVPTAAEIGTMVSVGAALEGHVPSAQDFLDAAILVGGMKAAPSIARKMRDVYKRTGIKPDEVARQAEHNPTVKQDLLSLGNEMPDAFKPLSEIPDSRGRIEPVIDKAMTTKALPLRAETKVEPSFEVVPRATPPAVAAEGAGAPPIPPARPTLPGPAPENPEAAVLARIGGSEAAPRELTWDKFYTAAVDDLHPIKQLEKALAGEKVKTPDSPYDLARLTRGAYGKADQFLDNGTFDFATLRNTGKGLKQVLEPVKDDLDGFRAYAVSARALELQKRGIETGVPMAEASAVAKSGKEKYGKVFTELQDYQNSLVAYLRDSGIVSKDAYEMMLEANKNYIPFYRLAGEDFGGPGSVGRGFSVRNPIKAIKGSEMMIVDPIESIIKNTYLYVTLAERNNVGRSLYDMVNRFPEAAAELGIERVATPVRPIEVSAKETGVEMVGQFLRDHGFDVQMADSITIFRAMRQPVAKDEVRFFEDGKAITLKVPEAVAEAMQGLDRQSFGIMTRIIATPARLLRAGTTLSPEFMLRNFTRDQMSAFILSVGGFRPIWDTIRGMGSLIGKDEHYQNWLKSGGANSAFVSIDRQYIQQNIFKLSKETGLIDSVGNVVRSPLEMMRLVSETIENSTRIGEFKRMMEAGADPRTAGLGAREVTLDFARVGAQMRAMNAIAAFFNPGVQGIDRMIRAAADSPANFLVRTTAAVTIPSVLLWAVNHEDPRYKELPQWQKDLFWIVLTDKWEPISVEDAANVVDKKLLRERDGQFEINNGAVFRIPKPFEVGILFGSLPERALEKYFGENPDAFVEFQRSVFEGMTPNYMPTAMQPIVEQFANRSLFTGNPIVPQYVEDLLPEYRYTEYTHEVTKMMGSAIAAMPGMKTADIASPAVIENYWRGWTGGLGQYLLQAADAALVATGTVPDPVKPASTLADMPIIKAFVVRHPSAQASSIQLFYDRYYERKQVYDTIMAKAAEGDVDAVAQEYKLNPGALADLGSMRESLTQISKTIRLVNKNPEFTADEKRQLIDSMYMQMIGIAREGVKTMRQIDEALAGEGQE